MSAPTLSEKEAEELAKNLSEWLDKNSVMLRSSEESRLKWKQLLFIPHRSFHGLIVAVK